MTTICNNLKKIQENITIAAERSGRPAGAVQLIAVSKRMDSGKIHQAIACGQYIFGENYLQEAQQKLPILDDNLRWHFIGHLQSNKARLAVKLFDVIETVDRIKIARAIDQHAAALNRDLRILVQVNIGREKQKHGVLPEDTEELLESIRQTTRLTVSGLMGMPPWSKDPETSRKYFRELKELSVLLSKQELFSDNNNVELSMGMSSDYVVAIEEGATMVRVGTALFGRRE